MGDNKEPPRDANLPPGYDEEDPYEGESLEEYPEWWRRNIELFRAHGMRAYRPPRFSDGELVPIVVSELSDEISADISIRTTDPSKEHGWKLRVDGETVATMHRRRDGDGFSEYDIDSKSFRRLVIRHA